MHNVVKPISVLVVRVVGKIVSQRTALMVHPCMPGASAYEIDAELARQLLAIRTILVVVWNRLFRTRPEIGLRDIHFEDIVQEIPWTLAIAAKCQAISPITVSGSRSGRFLLILHSVLGIVNRRSSSAPSCHNTAKQTWFKT